MHNHHSTCYIPGCANPRAGECGFCEEHRQAMRTPKQTVKNTAALPDYTHCPCGVPATRDGLCGACYAREAPRVFR